MTHPAFAACIDACNACALACDHCAAACLEEPDVQEMADCIRLDLDCAQVCRLAVAYMARDGSHVLAACTLCGDICEACAAECARHDADHCRACADACNRCARACRAMSQPQGQGAGLGRQAQAH